MTDAPYETWAWIVYEGSVEFGRWGLLTAAIPVICPGLIPLMSRSRLTAETLFGPVAASHAERTGCHVRLVHLVEQADLYDAERILRAVARKVKAERSTDEGVPT